MSDTQPLTIPRRLTARLGSFSWTASFKSGSTYRLTCCATCAYLATTLAANEERSLACRKVFRIASESSTSACRNARHAISSEPAMETCSFSSSLRQKIVSSAATFSAADRSWSWETQPTESPSICIDGRSCVQGFCVCGEVEALSALSGRRAVPDALPVRLVGRLASSPSDFFLPDANDMSLCVDGCVTMPTGPPPGVALKTSVTTGPSATGGACVLGRVGALAAASIDVDGARPSVNQGCLRHSWSPSRSEGFTRSSPRTKSLASAEIFCHAALVMEKVAVLICSSRGIFLPSNGYRPQSMTKSTAPRLQ
mmetsp:Transcript_7168/g.21184  ORF Transcript_7168/g.21184 Transcript_7168/m.21184 type:complete len:312 (-) Transcript_7168:771-1706(-)